VIALSPTAESAPCSHSTQPDCRIRPHRVKGSAWARHRSAVPVLARCDRSSHRRCSTCSYDAAQLVSTAFTVRSVGIPSSQESPFADFEGDREINYGHIEIECDIVRRNVAIAPGLDG
jgi:hypothetical protein